MANYLRQRHPVVHVAVEQMQVRPTDAAMRYLDLDLPSGGRNRHTRRDGDGSLAFIFSSTKHQPSMRRLGYMVKQLLVAFTLLATSLVAANVSGKWSAQVPGRNGETREQIFTLKADGEKLTGSIAGGQGDTPIADGKVAGDTVSFTMSREMNGNTIKWTYTGTVSGDEMKMKRAGGQGEPREFVAKRAK